MTLNNGRQKINDCLGNPVEIGIAVIWRVTDTAKVVFNVDNYKEYLSLQCDSALRNIVRIYPYDAAGNIDSYSDPGFLIIMPIIMLPCILIMVLSGSALFYFKILNFSKLPLLFFEDNESLPQDTLPLPFHRLP